MSRAATIALIDDVLLRCGGVVTAGEFAELIDNEHGARWFLEACRSAAAQPPPPANTEPPAVVNVTLRVVVPPPPPPPPAPSVRRLRQQLAVERLSRELLCAELSELEDASHHAIGKWRAAAIAAPLLMEEEREKWQQHMDSAQAALRQKDNVLKLVKKQLGVEHQKRRAAELAAKEAKEAVEAAQEAAERGVADAQNVANEAACAAEDKCELRLSEMRELLGRARAEIEATEERADAAEKRAAAAQARATAAEEAAAEELVPPICPHCGKRGPSPPPRVHSDLMYECGHY